MSRLGMIVGAFAAAGIFLALMVIGNNPNTADFFLKLVSLLLVGFLATVSWPLAVVAAIYILRNQIGDLVTWITGRAGNR